MPHSRQKEKKYEYFERVRKKKLLKDMQVFLIFFLLFMNVEILPSRFFIQIKLNECRIFLREKRKGVHENEYGKKSDGKLSTQHVYTLRVGNEN